MSRMDVKDTTIHPQHQTRTVVVQYETLDGAKTCKRLVDSIISPYK